MEDHFSELQSEMGRLRAEKREVESDIVRHETRHGALEKRLEQIKEQLAEAKSFAVKVEALQAEYKKVQEPSQKLRDSLGKLNNALKGIVKEVSDSETTAAAAQRRANRRNNVAIPAVVMERLARVRLDVEPLRLSVGKLVRERNLLGAEAAG